MGKDSFWTKTPVIVLMTGISCFLWGSAFPSVKVGYRLFAIDAADTAGQILFAGLRFVLAGLLVLAVGSAVRKKWLFPRKQSWPRIALLSCFQTIGQYFFFYIGVAHTTGVKSSVLVAMGGFFSLLVAALLFHYEKLTWRKALGCLMGFAGVVLIHIPDGLDAGFRFWGEGCVLLSSVMYAFSSVYVKRASREEDPLLLSGWQFLLGGLVMSAGGAAAGGRLSGFTAESCLLLFYMACISAGAYSLWSLLLKHNPVSRITVFGFMNPVIGVILSAVILGEQNQAFTLYGLGALVLVALGIIVVNRK